MAFFASATTRLFFDGIFTRRPRADHNKVRLFALTSVAIRLWWNLEDPYLPNSR
jgi:hypothetical protein